MDRGAWQTTVWVAKSQTQLSDWTTAKPLWVRWCFSTIAFNILPLSLIFRCLTMICIYVDLCLLHWDFAPLFELILWSLLPNLGIFFSTLFLHMFLGLCFFFLSFLRTYSLFCSDWIIYIALYSSLLIFSSFHFIMLLKSLCYILITIFSSSKIFNFYLSMCSVYL